MYSRASSFHLLQHIAWYGVKLERPSACELTVVHEVKMGSAVQQERIESAFPGTAAVSVRFFKKNDTMLSYTMCVVLD